MYKVDVVIVGLNDRTLELVELFRDQKVLVIDERNFSDTSAVLDFEDDLLFGIYQGSLEASMYQVDDYEQMKEFYQMITAMNYNNKQTNLKLISAQLEQNKINVLKGRIKIKSNQLLNINYLSEDTEVSFDRLVLNTSYSEKKDDRNPFVFTLEEILATQLLPEEMIIEIKTMKDLEIAKMFSNFSTKVIGVMTKNVFTEIDHLMFRDSVRDAFDTDKFELIDKAQILKVEEHSSYGMLEIEKINDQVFPPKKEIIKESFTVLLKSYEHVANNFDLGLEKLEDYDSTEDLISFEDKLMSQTIHLTPAYVHIQQKDPSEDRVTLRINADELKYFSRIHETQGGLEVMINKNTLEIESAIIYCHESLVLRDIVRLIMEHQIPLSYFEETPIGVSSVMSIFVDIAHKYRMEVSNDNPNNNK